MTKEELKEDINKRNPQLEVIDVAKFGSYAHLSKIELRTIEQAQRVQQKWNSLWSHKNSKPPNKKRKNSLTSLFDLIVTS